MTFGRLLPIRRAERFLRRAKPSPIALNPSARIEVDDPSAVIPTLVRDGLAEGFRLKPEVLAEILAFARTHPCFERDEARAGFLPGDIAAVNADRDHDVVAAYYFDTVQRCAAIMDLVADPLLRSVADSYLGKRAEHIRTRLWWSFPGERIKASDLHAAAQDSFHFDMNDWQTLKFFFYITPVTERSGPHQYIRGSHDRRALRHQLTLVLAHDGRDVVKRYGAGNLKSVVGDAGFGFAEDPFVFHTGTRCLDAPRLILELEYGPSTPSPSYRYGVRL
ncbi:phytanoyl-CoA dioxygenase family protein [Caulobacter sp.]|uniref:phytanoyl-CoA dioxygenase family protein n=1 Tax=Caulobacter sp. TaxID=78 RepID=UPI003BAE9BDD